MIRYELKKIVNNKFIVVFLVLFFCLDIFVMISKNIGQINYISSKQYDNYRRLYNDIRGDITSEKVNTLQEAKLNMEVYGLYPEVAINAINNNRDYEKRAKDVVDMALDNAYTYNLINQQNRYINSICIANIFRDRHIDCYYETDGIDEYLKYDYSTIIVIIIIIMSINILWINDRKTEMYRIVNTTYYGKNRLNVIKVISVLIITVISEIFFRILELITFYIIYGFDGISQPLYSVKEYADTLYNGSIISAMLIDLLLKILGCIMVSLIVAICVLLVRNTILAYGLAFILSIVLRYPVKSFDNYRMFRSRNVYIIKDYLFTDISIMILIGIIPLVSMLMLLVILRCYKSVI